MKASLIAAAREAATRAYAPYSHFTVGAALLGTDGKIYTGCNVENASYGLTLCAERNALFHAVASGCCTFEALAIVAPTLATPCGACCQVLAEFCPGTLPIYLSDHAHGPIRATTLGELFPTPFTKA